MELDELIKKRRSCRAYLDKKVPWEMIGSIIEAATLAPSSGNLQNWVFIVATNEEKKQELARLCLKQSWMAQAPVILVVCDRKDRVLAMYPRRGELYSVQNCALAAQNIMLKAEEFGLATCWVGAFDEVAIGGLLKLPSNIVPELIVTIGYRDEREVLQEQERIPIDAVTFFDEYGNKKIDTTILPMAKQIPQMQQAVQQAAQQTVQQIQQTVGAGVEQVKEQTKRGLFGRLFKRR